MKKLLAVIIALAMVLSMSTMAFAELSEADYQEIMDRLDAISNDPSLAKPSLILTTDASRTALGSMGQYCKELINESTGEPFIDPDTGKPYYIFDEVAFELAGGFEALGVTDAEIKELIIWNEVYGYQTSLKDGWLNYYGMQIADVMAPVPSVDENGNPVVDENGAPVYQDKETGDVVKGMFGVIGGLAGDVVKGEMDNETAQYVTGEVSVIVANAVGGMTGSEIDPETQQGIKDAVSGIVGVIGGGSSTPADPKTSEEYAQEIIDMINSGVEVSEITTKIVEDIRAGVITADQVPEIVEILKNSDQIDPSKNETVEQILAFFDGIGDVIGGGSGDGIQLPDFGDISLPIDIGGSEGGSFLDTILGIIGSIGDLFGGGSEDNNGGNGGNGGSGWGDDNSIPDTGDVSFVAVAAVAAVAGVAFVLTRKKRDDAE